jgi:hypothetical protein
MIGVPVRPKFTGPMRTGVSEVAGAFIFLALMEVDWLDLIAESGLSRETCLGGV